MLYDREIIGRIDAELKNPDILILLGSRQVGKTSILKIISKKLDREKRRHIFLDLDIETNLEYLSSYQGIIKFLEFKGLNPHEEPLFLLLDEFQRAGGVGKTLKNLYDHHENIKIIATGSSSLEISETISESMSGRKLVFKVFPLNFREFLTFKGKKELISFYDSYRAGENIPGFIFKEYEPLIIEKLVFGSYPGAVLENNIERKGRKIEDILNSYLRKDIKEYLGITDTVQFKRLLELLGITFGNLLNSNNIAGELGTYHRKVREFINIAVETYIVDMVRPFFRNRKNEITRNPKIYFEDTGMRNFLIKNVNRNLALRTDAGALVENFVYNELKGKLDVFTEIKFWRTKNATEVDFLLIKNQEILPVEVKSGSHVNIPRALISFCQKEKLSRAVIINKDTSQIISREGIEFYFVPYIFSGGIIQLLD